MSTLVELNALRVAANMKPLKAWKESKAKLDAAIAKLSTAAQVNASAEVRKDIEELAKAGKASGDTLEVTEDMQEGLGFKGKSAVAKPAIKKSAKPKAPAKAPAKPKEAKKPEVEGVSISTIAADLGIDPKVARAKLRRQDEVPCIEGSQWLFNKADVPAIKAILKGDARKKA